MGRQGETTGNFLNRRPFASPSTKWEFNPDKANAVLDAAGWKRGADGIRAKDGKRLKFLFQTSINAPRQKTQAIVKQAAAKAGIEMELKSVTASVFFSSDAANPDTYPHFYADLQMYTTTMGAPDPQQFMIQFVSSEASSKDNKWAGRNITRWRNEDYDRVWRSADTEMDPVKRAALFVRMNDLVIQNVVVIPVLWRNNVSAATARLRGMDLSGWDSTLWRLPHWHKV
jgi:peptide/nickel transport system substrate-binding protein